VDITRGPRTSSETIDILKRYARSIGQIPLLLKKEKHGHIFNSMLIGYMKEAFLLVIDGYADIEDVDRAWMIVNSSEAGPFGGLDSVGLDVVFDILSAQAEREEGRREEYNKIINFLKPYIERGDLGVKTGKGFYTYPDAAWQQPDFLTGGEQ